MLYYSTGLNEHKVTKSIAELFVPHFGLNWSLPMGIANINEETNSDQSEARLTPLLTL